MSDNTLESKVQHLALSFNDNKQQCIHKIWMSFQLSKIASRDDEKRETFDALMSQFWKLNS